MKLRTALLILVLPLLCISCSDEKHANSKKELELKERELQLQERELDQKEKEVAATFEQKAVQSAASPKRSKELRYLFFANGGIIGYFDDGTVAGCPRCDFCRSNIIPMFDKAPHATYTVEADGSLLIDGKDRETPVFNAADGDGWALIDYKWHIKPPQY